MIIASGKTYADNGNILESLITPAEKDITSNRNRLVEKGFQITY